MSKSVPTPKRNHTLIFRRLKNLLMHEEDLVSGLTIRKLFGNEAQSFLDHHRKLADGD